MHAMHDLILHPDGIILKADEGTAIFNEAG
jgi:hypothetical protein